VPWRRLDGQTDSFEPSNELANVLSHLGTSSRRGCMSRGCRVPTTPRTTLPAGVTGTRPGRERGR
jgi:hypothetical protein